MEARTLFLRGPEDAWPQNKAYESPEGDAEFKRSTSRGNTPSSHEREDDLNNIVTFVSLAYTEHLKLDPTRHSSWLKLRRMVVWVRRFIERNASGRITGELSAHGLKKSEMLLVG